MTENKENILPQSQRSFLTEELVSKMKTGELKVSINCRTFHCFVFYGLMDYVAYVDIAENDDQPWRESENWDLWGVSRDDESLRQEEFAFFQMHCDMCLHQFNFKVRPHHTMGLGLFARSADLKYEHLYPGPVHQGLFGFLEFLDEDELMVCDNHPSLYSDRDNNNAILYGPLYFCNHQDSAPPLEDLNPVAKAFQVIIKTQEVMTVHRIEIDGKVETLIGYENSECAIDKMEYIDGNLSQDVDYKSQEAHSTADNLFRSVVTEHGQSYWVVMLNPSDMSATVGITTQSSNSSINQDYTTQIFANYGPNYTTMNENSQQTPPSLQLPKDIRLSTPQQLLQSFPRDLQSFPKDSQSKLNLQFSSAAAETGTPPQVAEIQPGILFKFDEAKSATKRPAPFPIFTYSKRRVGTEATPTDEDNSKLSSNRQYHSDDDHQQGVKIKVEDYKPHGPFSVVTKKPQQNFALHRTSAVKQNASKFNSHMTPADSKKGKVIDLTDSPQKKKEPATTKKSKFSIDISDVRQSTASSYDPQDDKVVLSVDMTQYPNAVLDRVNGQIIIGNQSMEANQSFGRLIQLLSLIVLSQYMRINTNTGNAESHGEAADYKRKLLDNMEEFFDKTKDQFQALIPWWLIKGYSIDRNNNNIKDCNKYTDPNLLLSAAKDEQELANAVKSICYRTLSDYPGHEGLSSVISEVDKVVNYAKARVQKAEDVVKGKVVPNKFNPNIKK